MRTMKITLFCMLLSVETAQADVITIRADEWCPFNCEPGERPGYGIEIFTEAMKTSGHSVDYKIEPWTRALKKAQEGKSDAVIGANAGEVAEYRLKTGKEPIGVSSDCIFARGDSVVTFSKPADLSKFSRIGIINDYDYSEGVQKWLRDPKNADKIDGVAGDEPVAINLRKLEGGRVDAVIEDKSVMAYMLKKLSLDQKIKSVGCVQPAKLFIGFSAKNGKTDALSKALDTTVSKMRASGDLAKILAKYGVVDWK